MSENQKEQATASKDPEVVDPPSSAIESDQKLSGLMSSGEAPRTKANKPDLDGDALRAAQDAIAEGERALAAARAQLSSDPPPAQKRARHREVALRLLLAANVLAMLVVMSLPMPSIFTSAPSEGPESAAQPSEPRPVTAPTPAPTQVPPAGPRLADKYNQALLASENRDYSRAVELLQEYLVETPRMPASRLVNVYRAMAHYSSAIGRFRESQDFERRAQAVTQSHSLPEDLVEMAKAAADSGDQESLRQVWARFLLQQRQIPSSLYQHVAEAYLQLGDSYRVQANEAAEKARLTELQRADELLRQQAKDGSSKR